MTAHAQGAPARSVTFRADGRTVRATEGQSIAAALWAHGDRALSRSMKYHRPRGYSCGIGRCNDCAMRVDGIPNVKTCVTPVAEGMEVSGQNAWPSVRRDVFRINDLAFARGLDHHTSFVKPRFLYPLFTRVMRGFAGWGRLPDAPPETPPNAEALRPDVLVVGGGPAGLAAATAAARAGADTVLLEESSHLGGAVARMRRTVIDPDAEPLADEAQSTHDTSPAALVARWIDAAEHEPDLRIETGTHLSATYGNGLMIAHRNDRIIALRPQATVIATGGLPVMGRFAGNDLPGIMSPTAIQRLLHVDQVAPGKRAVVYGAGTHGIHAALDLHDAGVRVAAVLATGAAPTAWDGAVEAARSAGIPIITNARVSAARGWSRVRRVRVETPTGTTTLRADTLVVALGAKTAPEAFQSMGCALRYLPAHGGAVPILDADLQTSVAGLFAAGDACGIGSLAAARASGTLAGLGAARHAGKHVDKERMVRERDRLVTLAATHGGPGAWHSDSSDNATGTGDPSRGGRPTEVIPHGT